MRCGDDLLQLLQSPECIRGVHVDLHEQHRLPGSRSASVSDGLVWQCLGDVLHSLQRRVRHEMKPEGVSRRPVRSDGRAPIVGSTLLLLAALVLGHGCEGNHSKPDGGSGGSAGGVGDLGGGGASGGGGATGSGGRNGGSSGAGTGGAGGGNGGSTPAGMCRGGLLCAAGQSCGLDCMRNTGSVSGLAGPGITCTCSNGAYLCRVVYEGTAGSVPPACPAGSTCSSRCSVCQVPADGNMKTRTCFCSADLVWVCD